MNLKSLVSLTIVILFIGKLFLVDSNAADLLFQGNISFVKPNCSKKQSIKKNTGQFQFHKYLDSDDSNIELSSFCTTQFNFEVYSWELIISEVLHVEEESFTSNLSFRYLDSQSPPPKMV